MKLARWLLPLVSLAIVLLVVWWDSGKERIGPGPLHPAHDAVAELAHGANCEACHRSGAGVDPVACNRCHEPVGGQLAAQKGFHGNLPAADRNRCEACHGEHHGAAVALIAPHAFARAGVADVPKYDHRGLGFRLTGAHAALPCAKCHAKADAAEPPRGGRFLGLSQTCTSCHQDPHKDAFGADCAGCHGQEAKWKAVPGFRHETFALADAHRAVACEKCHAAGTDRDVVREREKAAPVRNCGGCHADPHRADAAKSLRLARTEDCAKCHDAVDWKRAVVTVEQHATYGFVLAGPHAKVACATCHGDAAKGPRWRDHAPALASCGACHEQPHAPALLAAATAARGPADGCAGCHVDAEPDWRKGTISAEQHAATGFPLAVPHGKVACAKCHTGETRTARYPGRPAADCRACHADVHKGQFDRDDRYHQCTACHSATSFQPAAFGVAMHAATKFPLTGAHDAVSCVACHREQKAGARTFCGTPGECVACHADVHKGGFDRPGRPRAIEGRTACLRCHDTQAFAPVVGSFDHAMWTGYELAGAHGKVDCAGCHPRRASAAPGTPRLGAAPGTRCAACHVDVHAGQFAVGGATDCARCHTATTFRDLHFDHQQTRFPLDKVHAPVACAKCHPSYPVGEAKIVRYRPLGVLCGDCHKLGVPGAPQGGAR